MKRPAATAPASASEPNNISAGCQRTLGEEIEALERRMIGKVPGALAGVQWGGPLAIFSQPLRGRRVSASLMGRNFMLLV